MVLLADAVASHFEPESFASYAAAEIAAAPYFVAGRCFRPDCSAPFVPRRDWQRYCCDACRLADVREARAWGHKAADALLVWRMHKYATDPPKAALARAARRYVTQVQSLWLASRQARAARALGVRR